MFRLTPITRNIILFTVAVYIFQNLNESVTLRFSLWGLASPNFEPYQFFTYMFLHGSFSHIFFNLLALASFAPILESEWGDKKFLFFYIATGIGAGMIYGVANYFMGGEGLMLGASGALYGVLMAFGLLFPNMEMMLLFPPIPVKAKYMVFLMGGMTFLLDRSGTVAHLAHFGGALVGFLIIMYWRKSR